MSWTPQKSAKSSDYGICFGFSKGKADRSRSFAGRSKRHWPSEDVMQLDYVRAEIERMRLQVHRQRGDIRKLQQAAIPTASAEALLQRMGLTSSVSNESGSRKSSDQWKAKPWEVVHGDRTPQMVRGECEQSTLDKSVGRGSTQGDARRMVLSSRSSNHRGDRPVCGSGLG